MLSKREIVTCIEKILKEKEEIYLDLSQREGALSPQEMFELGDCYIQGIFAPIDYARAYQLMEKSASLGCADGYYGLAYMYSFGFFVERDYQKTLDLANKAIDLGSKRAIDLLGVCHYSGFGTAVDMDKAISLVTEAGLAGVPNALTNQGAFYGVNRDYEKAYEYYEKGLLAGSINSIGRIARYYLNGTVVECDIDFGLELLKYGVTLKNPYCLCLLAEIYIDGLYGEAKDFKTAFEYLSLAEKKKFKKSYSSLVLCYFDGLGTLPNPEKAEYYLSLCLAEGATPPDDLYLANKYIHSLSHIPGNKEKGFAILQEYKDSDNGFALCLLGECYVYGVGTEVSFDMAKHYFEKAFECGKKEALVYIGDCYFYGRGVEFNLEKAGEYYLKGKELDIPLAYTRHASLLKYIWARKDEQMVIDAYELAVSKGCTCGMAEYGNFLLDKTYPNRKRAFEVLSEACRAGEPLAYLGLGKYYRSVYNESYKSREYFELAIGKGATEACSLLAEAYEKGEISRSHEKDYVSALYYYKMAKGHGYKVDNKIEEMKNLIGLDLLVEDFTLVKCDINSNIESLPYGIKVIGKESFRGNLKIKKIPSLPSTLQRIEDRAFMDCRKLRVIELCATVDYMGADVFLGTSPSKVIYYYIGEARRQGWNQDYDVIRRHSEKRVVRFRPKKGRTRGFGFFRR